MTRQFRSSRLRRTALAGAVAGTLLAGTVPAALAVFGDPAAVGGNAFATAACWSAVKTLQKGTATNSANGTQTVTISAVDTTRSFLMFSVRSNSNRPVGTTVGGRIASATTLEFVRATNESPVAAIEIRWYVVEYTCGVNVQRGATSMAATTTNVSITPVASTAQAFVTYSKTVASTDTTMDQNDTLVAELTSTSNLQIRVNAANASHTVYWQVIEFTSAGDISVQKGSTSLTGTALSTTATLPTPVTVGRTFVLTSFQTSGSGADVGSRLLRARLTNATTLTFDRAVSGTPDDITEIHWQAVQLTGSSVQHGSASFSSGQSQQTIGISGVDTARSIAFSSVAGPGGQSGGQTPYVTDDIAGVSSFTFDVGSSTQLVLDRASTVAAADVGWFVVQLR